MDNDEKKGSEVVDISSANGTNNRAELYDPSKESIWTRLGVNAESFKRAPGTTGGQIIAGGDNLEDLEKHVADNPMLQQKMKPRHLAMIAVGGSIGTGLFVASGSALATGGPAALVIAWVIIGVMLINVTQAIGELSILYPVSGGFYTLALRFLDPAFAFAMGWNYVFQWAITLPLEITVAGQTVRYWSGARNVPIAGWITVFWVIIIILSVFGTLGYAEEEFWSSCLKLLVAVMFIFIGIICIAGGGPSDGDYSEYLGGRYWNDPGAFANGFKGVCSVFVTAAFSFSGTELIGLAASETPNPRATVPSAIKGTFWRITIIYITTLTIIGLAVPYNDERLFGAAGGTNTSPFVILLDKAHIPGLNHLLNVTICISVISIGLSCVYAGSRTLTALAETGYAPKIFAYVDKSSRPLFSVIIILAFAAIAYIQLESTGVVVFNWLVALSGLSALFTWASICLCHIRFRAAWKAQGHSIEELPYQAFGGVYGSWLGFILICLVLIANFYVALFPVGAANRDSQKIAYDFFLTYLAAPCLLVFWMIGFAWKRTLPLKASEIDLDTGRKSWFTVEQMRAYRAERKASPQRMWYRIATYLQPIC